MSISLKKSIVSLLIAFLLCNQAAFALSKADTIKLYFDIAVAKLDTKAMHTIDSNVYNDVLANGKKVGIIGYADYLGDEQANFSLSTHRANNVKAYLLSMGVKETDIQMVVGKGEVSRTVLNGTAGYIDDRRVDIIPGGIKELPKPVVPKPAPAKPKDTLDLSKLKKNETIRLNNIYFLPGSHMVRKESMAELEKLYNTLSNHPTLRIQIEGHICCLPASNSDGFDYDSEDFNLSENRAHAIYDYLVAKGIATNRLKYKGFGKTKPLVMPEKNEDDENKNRRVEVRILSK